MCKASYDYVNNDPVCVCSFFFSISIVYCNYLILLLLHLLLYFFQLLYGFVILSSASWYFIFGANFKIILGSRRFKVIYQ